MNAYELCEYSRINVLIKDCVLLSPQNSMCVCHFRNSPLILTPHQQLSKIVSIESSRVGGTWECSPSPRNGKKLLQKTDVYSRGLYTFGEEAEIPEIVSKNFGKRPFSIEIFIKKSQNFLDIFQNFFIFGLNAQSFARMFLNFHYLMEIILQLLVILNSSKNPSRFSPKFSRICILVQIDLPDLGHFLINFKSR